MKVLSDTSISKDGIVIPATLCGTLGADLNDIPGGEPNISVWSPSHDLLHPIVPLTNYKSCSVAPLVGPQEILNADMLLRALVVEFLVESRVVE
jgi:hypothetical protein